MVERWPDLPYDEWQATCDTVHAHTQLLGKLCVALAPPEPQLQHAALRLTARGFETSLLPAPDGSGALAAAVDLRSHEFVLEHGDGPVRRIPLAPDRPVGEVTRAVLTALDELVGGVRLDLRPQEVPWTVRLDEDDLHHSYDEERVAAYLSAASRAALALATIRAPYRGRSSPVNAWWGTFDLAVSLFSGRPADPPSDDFITRNSADAQQVELGWWPGDTRYPRAAFYGFAVPAADGFAEVSLGPPAARFDRELGEFLLDWTDVVSADDPLGAAVEFGRSLLAHACAVCDFDPVLATSTQGEPPPVH